MQEIRPGEGVAPEQLEFSSILDGSSLTLTQYDTKGRLIDDQGGEGMSADMSNEERAMTSCFYRHRKSLIISGIVILLGIIAIGIAARFAHAAYTDDVLRDHDLNKIALPDDTIESFEDTAQANSRVPPLNQSFPYGKTPIRGVNLGGWLVLEPFITPSLFESYKPSEGVVDEWSLCEILGPQEAHRVMDEHYRTFVTEQDFQKMRDAHIDHVRIPIGYWALKGEKGTKEPFVEELSWKYLLLGLQWARKYGIRAMVELHGAPGSQNGWNHSGR